MTNNPFQDLKTLQVKKGTVLLAKGQHSRYAYQVVKGCLKSYVEDEAGKEHIVQFAPEGWYISDMNSFFNGAEAAVTIAAIEDSEVLLMDRSLHERAKSMPQEDLLQYLKITQNNIIALNKRLILLLSSTAQERYLDFITTYPSLVQRLPLKLIASYLGITPEFLSRVRKKLASK